MRPGRVEAHPPPPKEETITTTTTEAPTRDEKIAADQEAMDDARERLKTAAEAGDPSDADELTPDSDIVEDDDGQTALRTYDPILLTTAVRGPRPSKAEVKVKSYKEDIDHDLNPGDGRLYVVQTIISTVDGLGSNTRTHNAEAVRILAMDEPGAETTLTPGEAIQALYDLRTRSQFDRAVIDHAASVAAMLLDNEAPENGPALALMMRERLYPRFHIDDDPYEVTHGTDDEVADEEMASVSDEETGE